MMEEAGRFAYAAWTVGFCLTCLALSIREIIDAWRVGRAALNGEDVDIPPSSLPRFLDAWSGALVRAALWPLYLLRPW